MKGVRIMVTITPQAAEMVKYLLETGLWGRTNAEVAQRLIYRQLQEEFLTKKVKIKSDG